jgi:L-iditol 2-dehydrogenase
MSVIPETATAAALVEHGAPLELIQAQVPERLEHGSILVRTTVATICGTDVHHWTGEAGAEAARPRILGHEMVGRVARLGEGVTADSIGQPLAEGDRIVWAHGWCGQCYECVVAHQPTSCTGDVRTYMTRPLGEYPYLTGGFAEYCYVFPRSGRVKVPDSISDAVASASSCALRTVVHAFDELGVLDDRHSVVIQGSGPLGLFAVAKAVRSAAARIIVIGAPAARMEIARRWGATDLIDIEAVPDAAERGAAVRALTDGKGADVVIELSGGRSAFLEGFDMLRRGGRYLVVGQLHPDAVPFRPRDIILKRATIIGSASASIEHYHRSLLFLDRNRDRFDWDAMISNTYPLARINEALERVRRFEEIKAAISFP